MTNKRIGKFFVLIRFLLNNPSRNKYLIRQQLNSCKMLLKATMGQFSLMGKPVLVKHIQ